MEQKSMLLVILIAALLVTVGLQTVQLAALGTSGGGAVVTKSVSSPAKTSGSSAGGSLQNLPSMVGGC